MKLEKGKFYRTRSGEKVECLTTDAEGVQNCVVLRQSGGFYAVEINGMWDYEEKSPYDITSEWSDVVIPWEDYPRWCNWVAMDKSGKWFCYEEAPEKKITLWYAKGHVVIIPSEYAPKGFEGDWKESKFERSKKD